MEETKSTTSSIFDTNNQNHLFPGIYIPNPIQQPYNQQQVIDLMNQQHIIPINTTTDNTPFINDLQSQINELKTSKDRKAQCLHMLTDLFFNREKLTFEECRNLLGMIHAIDEENLLLAEIILKNKSNGREENNITKDKA
jgi:hypothetical protein